MKTIATLLLFLLLGLGALPAPAQTAIDTNYVVGADTFEFWMQTPQHYDPQSPPAIVVWMHHLGQTVWEMRDGTDFDVLCNDRNWIAATFRGPYEGKHWNARRGQEHCKAMFDWVWNHAPFSMDSIYMIGGSMGGAAGQAWHNNNCGIDDYMIAATFGGSHILDTQLRQEQYLAGIGVTEADTNFSMYNVFQGLPQDSKACAFEYHRASAIFLADTTQSMHYNSLHLPVYNTWGSTTTEWLAYGYPAQTWDTLRRALGADTTVAVCSNIAAHGLAVMNQDSAIEWCSHFTRNRFPDFLSIGADENDQYYWTQVDLFNRAHEMARYGVRKNSEHRTLDITLLRNVQTLEILCRFPWRQWDTLTGAWINLDSIRILNPTIRMSGVPEPNGIIRNGHDDVRFTYDRTARTVSIPFAGGGEYKIMFNPDAAPERSQNTATSLQLVSAYPNPFNSQVNLDIQSNRYGRQEIHVYDITGRLSKTLSVDLKPGTQRISVSAAGLPSGVYFVQLSGSTARPLKILLLK